MSTLTPNPRDRLRQELPGWLREDLEFRRWILSIASSSMDKVGLYISSRTVDFHECKQQQKADRRLVMPFLDARAAGLPEKPGIEVYANSTRMPVN